MGRDIFCCCDLLENTYLCGSNNNLNGNVRFRSVVVICLKIRTFVVAITTPHTLGNLRHRCDLLENTYLCGSNNNLLPIELRRIPVVICLKIRTFVVAITTNSKT